jgi:trypsin
VRLTSVVLGCLLLTGASIAGAAEDGPLGIVGGEETTGFPAVVEINFGEHYASGVLISERIVLTVGHAVSDVIGTEAVTEGLVYFGDHTTGEEAAPTQIIGVEKVARHRYFLIDGYDFFDVGLVYLAESAGVEPMRMNTAALEGVVSAGDRLQVVGFGYTSIDATGAGIKRVVEMPVEQVGARYVEYDATGVATCNGDSGGPHIATIDGVPSVVAVTSIGNCRGEGRHTRLDAYWDDFLRPVIDSWEGPCRLDGACTTEGCRTPDPDCDPCGFDGVCATGCPARDLDCPIEGRFRQLCDSDAACESGICLTAVDDPGVRYCSYPCTEATIARDCGPVMECVAVDGYLPGERACAFPAPTPAAEGESCEIDQECRSGHCGRGACVELCSSAMTCDEGRECAQVSLEWVCVVPEDGGCCSAGSARGGLGDALLVLGTALLGWRRRRRRPSGRREVC